MDCKKLFLAIALLAAAIAPAAQAAQGALIFSMKFENGTLRAESVKLIPGESPDYIIEIPGEWLKVNLIGGRSQDYIMKVPDPRYSLYEGIINGSTGAARLYDPNAKLVFVAPNLQQASKARVSDSNGTELLMIDYRKGLSEEPSLAGPDTQPYQDATSSQANYVLIAAGLALAAVGLGYYSLKKDKE